GRLFAVGEREAAAHLGRQAVLLAAALGVVLAALTAALAQPLLALLGGHGQVGRLAALYIRIAAIGLPCALIAVAAQGYFRGVARLMMPLLVLIAGNLVNAVLELWFVYGLRLGIAGSAWGTVIAQLLMAGTFLAIVGRGPRGQPLLDRRALRSLARTGGEILVRTGALYASFLIAGAVLARTGAASLAAHQIVFQLWNMLALVLDAIAIAAQVLVSHQLALRDADTARALATRALAWSLAVGIVCCLAFLALGDLLPRAFSSSPRVLNRVHAVWLIFAAMQPLNALVFALDGILLGAGDTRYLALAMVPCSLLVFAPLAITSLLAGWGIVGVWLALVALIAARFVAGGARFLGQGWAR
ncbi:MAG: MATE family efflux transporter, partial [Acidobacteriota bacterium]|nr:MATE family efflux transporter [Acidobacteriota bacterium]